MLKIPSALQAQFETALRQKAVPQNAVASYLKWLRYYLDFCQKYRFSETQRESLVHFLRKLDEKRQSRAQQQEASDAIALYYELMHSVGYQDEARSLQKEISPGKTPEEPSLPHGSLLRQADSSKKLCAPVKAPDVAFPLSILSVLSQSLSNEPPKLSDLSPKPTSRHTGAGR
jgi:hypothetical protein